MSGCGMCPHPKECQQWGGCRMEEKYREQPEPTAEDYCASAGHPYHGDDVPSGALDDPDNPQREEMLMRGGRCYCGHTRYTLGNRPEINDDGTLNPDLPTDGEVVFEIDPNYEPAPDWREMGAI